MSDTPIAGAWFYEPDIPKVRGTLDRSVAFSILLDVWPGYADSPVGDGSEITAFLGDWYKDPSTDMHEFARRWVTTPAAARLLGP